MMKKLKTICAALLLIAMLSGLCVYASESSLIPAPVKGGEAGHDAEPTAPDPSDKADPLPESTYKKPDLDIENMAALEPLTDPNAQRFVYIPASYFGVSELYGQEAIWGYMDGDEPALAIVHVEDGDITYKNGMPMSHVNYLDPGDIVESTSVTIAPSDPAEIYMDAGIYIEAGHDVAIYPFLDLIGMEPVELVWGYSGIHESRVSVDTSR